MRQLPKLTFLLLALLPLLAAQPDRFSTPACDSPAQQLTRHSHLLLCYDSSYKAPLWTAYELLPSQLHGSAPRPSHFRSDPSLAGPSARNRDFRHSGFSRGHMVPAKDLAFSDASIRETFLLSNVAPQLQSVNAGRWLQLENSVRRLAARSDAVYVFTGPIFDSPEIRFIGPGQVAVPTHFYKVILAVRGDRKLLHAAIIPNAARVTEPLDRFTVSLDEVERRTGLDFFSSLESSQ